MSEHKHEWLVVPGGDVSVTRARELGVKLPDHVKEHGLPYAIFVAGYNVCAGCGLKVKR